MLSLLIFLAFSWAQIIEPVSSLHVHSNQLFDSVNENPLISQAFLETDELNLSQRGLGNQKGNKGGTDDEQIQKLDVKKAISSIGEMQPVMLKPVSAALSKIMNIFGKSPLSDLFGHIRNLIRDRNSIQQYSRNSINMSDISENEFTEEALLVAVGELPNESIVTSWPLLQTIKKSFRNTAMETLFTNIMQLLENQPTLQKYAKLSEDLDKAMGLDKPFDLADFGLPVPTEKNPVVYFQLKDDQNPSIKFFVKVKLEEDQIMESILIKTDDSTGSIQNTYTEPNSKEGLEDLYKKLPISKLAKH